MADEIIAIQNNLGPGNNNVSGSGAANQVTKFSGSNKVTGISDVTFDGNVFKISGSNELHFGSPITEPNDADLDDQAIKTWIDEGDKTVKCKFKESDGTVHTETWGPVSGASADAEYLVLSLNGDLSNERKLVPGAALGGNDVGVNDDYTLNVDITQLAAQSATEGNKDFFIFYDASDGSHKKILAQDLPGSGGGAPDDASYVTISNDDGLFAERVLSSGAGIALTDGGANNNATLDIDVNSLTAETSVDDSADYFVMYDDSANAHKKVFGSNLPGNDSGPPTDASYITVNDESNLSSERTLAGSEGINVTDQGSENTIRETGMFMVFLADSYDSKEILMYHDSVSNTSVADGDNVTVTYTFTWP